MALTKIGKEGITGISNSADATFLTATSSEGVTFAGTLAVTGVHTVGNNAIYTSEGGAVTQNLVQGLTKSWARYTCVSVTPNDSFNVSGLTDNSTGDFSIAFTNDMNNTNYSATTGCSNGNSSATLYATNPHTFSSGGVRTESFETNASPSTAPLDCSLNSVAVHGDLA
jgi:hypothetical protein